MAENFNTRIELPLHECVNLALSSVYLRSKNILHNLFYIVDKPGAGKTMCIAEEVLKRGWGFCPYSPALERLEKFGGIPDLYWHNTQSEQNVQEDKELRTIWSVPQMITEINDKAKEFPFVVVLFDDWHLCDEDLQRIGFEVFTYYKLNNNPIAKNVIFILAGNESSAAGAKVQMSAIRNRTTILYSKADVKYWVNNFAVKNNIHPVGISFFNNPMNYDLLQEQESPNEQFGSPRSWTSLFNMISFLEENKDFWVDDEDYNKVIPRNYIQAITQGSISRAATERFMLHYDIYKDIDMKAFFDKEEINIPTDPVARYCYVTAITYEFYSRVVQQKVENKKLKLMDLYVKLNKELRKSYRELASTTLVNLGNIPENVEYEFSSGIVIIGEMVRSKRLSMNDVEEIRNITKILSSAKKD